MNLSHIDTCMPCYLQDHHNRSGELLLSAAVDGKTTVNAVMDAVLLELNIVSPDDDGFDWDEAKVTIANYFAAMGDDSKAFDSNLNADYSEDDSDAYCYAYFVLYY